ncbi:MAG: GntR family transcriptional regulator [Gammaproteobacteria bacterium]|nr:GntR family transcriptional regulator [Gammaproteobacteria bacterium]
MTTAGNVIQFPDLPNSHTGTSQEYAYRRLRHALMVGALAPGISLTIHDLANLLEVSATPIREALRQLGSENALVTLKNRRIQVPEMTPARLEALISLRCNLEVYAAGQALPYVNQVLIDEVERIDLEIDDLIDGGDRGSMVMLNQQLHSKLYRANPEQVVMPMIESLWLQLGPIMGVAARQQGMVNIADHHKAIIGALRQGDVALLASAIEADIREGIALASSTLLEQLSG